jgi:hypothetical protein
MHAQNIIAGCFFTLMALAGLSAIVGGGERFGPPARPKWAVASVILFGTGLLQFGLLNGFFILRSPRPEIVGFIGDLHQQDGKSASSSFAILSNAGWSPKLHTQYHGPKIVEGDMARVKYVEYDDVVVELTLLSGIHQGWALKESDDALVDLLLVLIGGVALLESQRLWRQHR